MNVERVLFLTPRILVLLFAAFLSLFALDVFDEGYGFWSTILALIMHLIPALVVLVVLAVAWRWEAVGGALLVILAIWYSFAAWPHVVWILLISGPLLAIAFLFLASSTMHSRKKTQMS